MEILKSGHQYYDGFFPNFFGWMLLEEIMSYPLITLSRGRKSQLIFFLRAWFSPAGVPGSDLRLAGAGARESSRLRLWHQRGAWLEYGHQSISSVTQLTWTQRLPTRHSDASREEVVCDISAKTVIIHSPSELRGFDQEKVLPLIFSVGKFKIYLNIHYCNS